MTDSKEEKNDKENNDDDYYFDMYFRNPTRCESRYVNDLYNEFQCKSKYYIKQRFKLLPFWMKQSQLYNNKGYNTINTNSINTGDSYSCTCCSRFIDMSRIDIPRSGKDNLWFMFFKRKKEFMVKQCIKYCICCNYNISSNIDECLIDNTDYYFDCVKNSIINSHPACSAYWLNHYLSSISLISSSNSSNTVNKKAQLMGNLNQFMLAQLNNKKLKYNQGLFGIALHIGIQFGFLETAYYLLNFGKNIDDKNDRVFWDKMVNNSSFDYRGYNYFPSCLIRASKCLHKYKDGIKFIYDLIDKYNANVSETHGVDESVLYVFARRNQLDLMLKFLDRYKDKIYQSAKDKDNNWKKYDEFQHSIISSLCMIKDKKKSINISMDLIKSNIYNKNVFTEEDDSLNSRIVLCYSHTAWNSLCALIKNNNIKMANQFFHEYFRPAKLSVTCV